MFISFVSLFLKALLVKARSRVFGTEIRISPTRWFCKLNSIQRSPPPIYLLTRVSIYRESHPQFRSPRDLRCDPAASHLRSSTRRVSAKERAPLLTKVNCFMLLAYLPIYRGIEPLQQVDCTWRGNPAVPRLQFAPFPPFGIAEGLHGLKR